MKISKAFGMVAIVLMGAALSACSPELAADHSSMQGKVVRKQVLNRRTKKKDTSTATPPKVVNLFVSVGHATVSPHVSTPHVSEGATAHTTVTPHEGTTTHVTETEGTTHTSGATKPAVKSVTPTTKSGFSTMHQSVTSHVYYPFWYTAAIANQDHHHETRYILVVTIKGNKKRLSVSKAMYNRAKVGQTISIDGSKFKIIKKS